MFCSDKENEIYLSQIYLELLIHLRNMESSYDILIPLIKSILNLKFNNFIEM